MPDDFLLKAGLSEYGWGVVTCECGRETGFRVDTSPGWVWHTGPIIFSEHGYRPFYIIVHPDFHGTVDPDGNVSVWKRMMGMSLPEFVGKHRADDTRRPTQRRNVVLYGGWHPAEVLSPLSRYL